jgi:hypothetical protein
LVGVADAAERLDDGDEDKDEVDEMEDVVEPV